MLLGSITTFANELSIEPTPMQEKSITLKLDSRSQSLLTKNNLDRIKKFIIQQGMTCLYSNMYNNNPCLEHKNFSAFLIPDPGPNGHPQWNMNCDVTKGDFNRIVIRNNNFKYRNIDFRNADSVVISFRLENRDTKEEIFEEINNFL